MPVDHHHPIDEDLQSDFARLASFSFPKESQSFNLQQKGRNFLEKKSSVSSCSSIPTTPTLYESLEEFDSTEHPHGSLERFPSETSCPLSTRRYHTSTTKPMTEDSYNHRYTPQHSLAPTASHKLPRFRPSYHNHLHPTLYNAHSNIHLYPYRKGSYQSSLTDSSSNRSSQSSLISPTRMSVSSASTVTSPGNSPLSQNRKRFSTASLKGAHKRHSRSKAISGVSLDDMDTDSDMEGEPESEMLTDESDVVSHFARLQLNTKPRYKGITSVPLKKEELSRMMKFNFEESVIKNALDNNSVRNNLEKYQQGKGSMLKYRTSNNKTDGMIDLDIISRSSSGCS